MTLDSLLRILGTFWPTLVAVLGIMVALMATAHILLYKSDVRAAIGWTGLVWLSPFVGAILYWLLGINRIRRRAGRIRRTAALAHDYTEEIALKQKQAAILPPGLPRRFAALATAVGTTTAQELVPGNLVEPLLNGDEAYPAMLEAIGSARHTVGMSSYILDNDAAGRQFADAFADAVRRGVQVRVLIDGVGARYSRPPITRRLAELGVPHARFLPHIFPLANPYFNLRSHRKLLVVDGSVGFVGGMNVREGCILARPSKGNTQDLHARVRGPVVHQFAEAFAFDWRFTAREQLEGPEWFPPLAPAGDVVARGIADGPDEDFDTLHDSILAALTVSTTSVLIVTPYFLPDDAIIEVLRVAAMRGVRVDIVLPAKNNLTVVAWAATAGLRDLLRWGCRIWFSQPPFDHSKIMVVDDTWSMIGSANWDPRSLRLNFEYNLECYDPALAARLTGIVQGKMAGARRYTLSDWQSQPLPVKLRNGIARLGQPYL
jgi:cardiolipin synthase A/B